MKKCGSVKILNKFDNRVFITLEKQATQLIDIKTGNTIHNLKGAISYYENTYSSIDLLERSTSFSLIDRTNSTTIKNLPKTAFAILDTAFSNDTIICSYSGNPIEAISINNFEKIWTTKVVGHFLKLEYSIELNKILGIRWDYEKGSFMFLTYININTGEIENEINLGDPLEVEFLKQGSFMLTSQGNLYSTLTGQITKHFDFEN